MVKRMLIDATHPEETRVVVLNGSRLEEFDFESATKKQLKGNIYLAKVTRVEPSLQAAFVDYGGNRHGFLAFSEIHPDYYQIPFADRQALLQEQAREDAEEAEHEDAQGQREAEQAERQAKADEEAEEHIEDNHGAPERLEADGESSDNGAADASGDEFDLVNSVNLRGVWNCMKYELIQMRKQGSGAIVNNSSLGGLVGIAGRAAYHASKHGVLGLTKSAALEYASRGITINAVCPGIIETPMGTDMLVSQPEAMKELMKEQPIGRLGRPEEVAAAVLWLCSPDASFVIGHALAVDGGVTIR